MYFLKLDSPELAIQRVRSRVASGGHGVEDEVIKRRYYRGNRLLEELYKSLVDDWLVIDNSGEEPVLIEEGHNNA